MPERMEGNVPPQEHEKQEKRHEKVWGDLATAFGGYSQVPDRVVGMAIAGQINNNGLEFGPKQLDDVVNQICERWEDQDPNADEIRAEIVKGMKEASEGWKEDKQNAIWPVLEAIERK